MSDVRRSLEAHDHQRCALCENHQAIVHFVLLFFLMAKKTAPILSPATNQKIEDFAEDLGKLLGHAQTKAQGWLGQRKQIVTYLQDIRDTADGLLAQLGHQAKKAVMSGKRGYRETAPDDSPAVVKAVKRKMRTMSATARKAISNAQKKRWAKLKAAQK